MTRRHNDVVLDEEATTVRPPKPDSGRRPVTRSRNELWLDLTLVLDNGPSMALWRPRLAAFVEMFERSGAFRSIQVRLLETVKDTGQGTLVLRGGNPGAPAHDLTDGVSDDWQREELYSVLATWAGRCRRASATSCPTGYGAATA